MSGSKAIQLQGELQLEIMRALWKVDYAGVEEVRRALPTRHRGAYTTIQTVLNRLAERGLLARKREGKSILYSARVSEADYYSRSLRQALEKASVSARRSALAHLVGGMTPAERGEMESLAQEVAEQKAQRPKA